MSHVPVKEKIWTIPCSEVWRWHCRWGISWTAQMVSLAQVSLALSSGLCKIKSMFRVGSNAWRHRKDYSIPAFIQSSVQGHYQQFHVSQPQRHYVTCILGRKGQRMPRGRLGASENRDKIHRAWCIASSRPILNCEWKRPLLVMKPSTLPSQSFHSTYFLLFLLLQLSLSFQELLLPPSPLVRSLLPSSYDRSIASLTCDHRLYQVRLKGSLQKINIHLHLCFYTCVMGAFSSYILETIYNIDGSLLFSPGVNICLIMSICKTGPKILTLHI